MKRLAAAIIGGRERGLDVADCRRVGDGDVRAVGFVDQRLAGERGSKLGDGRVRVDLQDDPFAGILGNRGAARQHDRDRLADEPDPAVGDDRRRQRLDLRQGEEAHRYVRHRTADLLRGDDAVHARNGERGRHIQFADRAVGDRAAQNDGMQLTVRRHVVAEGSPPAQEAQIFDPLDGFADDALVRAHSTPRASIRDFDARPRLRPRQRTPHRQA